jgi:hypothetical protein
MLAISAPERHAAFLLQMSFAAAKPMERLSGVAGRTMSRRALDQPSNPTDEDTR